MRLNIYLSSHDQHRQLKRCQTSCLDTVLQPTHIIGISRQTRKEMSEGSEKDYSDRTNSDEDESDEDPFMKFLNEDIHQCALLAANCNGDPFFPRTTQILLEYQLGRWVPRLRKPRDLYGVSSSGPLSPTRWPYHCEVIDEKVQHIDCTPLNPEPMYIPTGLEMEPLYPDSKENTVVYLAEDAYKEPCFVYSRVGGNRTPLKQPVDNCDNTLLFEARFESGNLQKFSFSACKFSVQKSKEGTGRVVMWKMGIRNSFTMEATFCGSTLGKKRGTHFNIKDLESMGYHFCDSLLDYCDPDRTKYYQCLKELEEMAKHTHINVEKAFEDSYTSLIEITMDPETSSQGSDSSESDSQNYLLKLTSQVKNKKKYLKAKKERNSIQASHHNAKEEVNDGEHLLKTQKESNSDVKDTKPDAPDNYMVGYLRRPLPNQGLVKIPGQESSWLLKKYLSSESTIQSLRKDHQRQFSEPDERPIQGTVQPEGADWYENCFRVTSLKCPVSKQTSSWTEKTKISIDLRHNLKNRMKHCTSLPSKKTDTNWTDDEKGSYRDKRIAQSQETLQYLLPVVESTRTVPPPQLKQLLNPGPNIPTQHQLRSATCINMKRYSTSWTPPRNPTFICQRHLLAEPPEWLPSVPQRSQEDLSPLKGLKKRIKQSPFWDTRIEDLKALLGRWETMPSSSDMEANVIKDKTLQAAACSQPSAKPTAPPLTRRKQEQPEKGDGRPAFLPHSQRDA
ncbi:cytosolic carboxypeptidase 3 isoform X8 [Oryctolagus cuniculus]|uniref:cytosolic carboxypeptidase 3 isoform X8 n=1 Tax=Oryctolagus cuniculus TaxID=9986 RepID=UPI003879E952